MIATIARPFALGVDTVQRLTPVTASALRREGMAFVVRYLGSLSAEELACIMSAGLACMPVTYAKAYSGMSAISELRKLAIPEGVTVWLDLEGETDPAPVIAARPRWRRWPFSRPRPRWLRPRYYAGGHQCLGPCR